jgi:hypothetical protein
MEHYKMTRRLNANDGSGVSTLVNLYIGELTRCSRRGNSGKNLLVASQPNETPPPADVSAMNYDRMVANGSESQSTSGQRVGKFQCLHDSIHGFVILPFPRRDEPAADPSFPSLPRPLDPRDRRPRSNPCPRRLGPSSVSMEGRTT